jgi:dihydroorotate dehydrogenase
MHKRLQGRIPLIGVGGILDGSDAAEKLDAGAALVQLYSGLIYRGPALVNECVDEIRRQRGATHVE